MFRIGDWFKQLRTRIIGWVERDRKAAAPTMYTHTPAVPDNRPLIDFRKPPPVPIRRRGRTRMPASWYRMKERQAARRRVQRDAVNARKALYWRMRILRENPNADPGRFMPKIRWVKGAAVRVGGKYD